MPRKKELLCLKIVQILLNDLSSAVGALSVCLQDDGLKDEGKEKASSALSKINGDFDALGPILKAFSTKGGKDESLSETV